MRGARMDDEADEVIELRERLAPYTGEVAVLDELRLNLSARPAWPRLPLT